MALVTSRRLLKGHYDWDRSWKLWVWMISILVCVILLIIVLTRGEGKALFVFVINGNLPLSPRLFTLSFPCKSCNECEVEILSCLLHAWKRMTKGILWPLEPQDLNGIFTFLWRPPPSRFLSCWMNGICFVVGPCPQFFRIFFFILAIRPFHASTFFRFLTPLEASVFLPRFLVLVHHPNRLNIPFLFILSLCFSSTSLSSAARYGRLDNELNYVTQDTLGEEVGSTDQLVIQTPQDDNVTYFLHANAFFITWKLMSVSWPLNSQFDLFDVTWRLKDVCLTPLSFFEDPHERIIYAYFRGRNHLSSWLFGRERRSCWTWFIAVHVPVISSLNLKWTNLKLIPLFRSVKSACNLFAPKFLHFLLQYLWGNHERVR